MMTVCRDNGTGSENSGQLGVARGARTLLYSASNDRRTRDHAMVEVRRMFKTFRRSLGFAYPELEGLESLPPELVSQLTPVQCVNFSQALWVKSRQNMVIVGPSRSGKSAVASALSAAALKHGEWPQYVYCEQCPALLKRGVGRRPMFGQLESDLLDTELVVVDDVGGLSDQPEHRAALHAMLRARRDVSTILVLTSATRSSPQRGATPHSEEAVMDEWVRAANHHIRLVTDDAQ